MKQEWQQPTLEVLDVTMTMGGPNGAVPDRNGKGANNRNPQDS
ncbi:paeninodin family lasso peptide [Paenibacillus sp. WST5]|uniref:Paeninodin family lasso peptide n=1 Tax=Paenibacillus sedimenti TaxID=2770274 RepID=A0A926KMX6_9BACL|nr:paeninodin family lasso peptide [Paenibacillus sedimenti]MBD0379731.1 paeninodin family lasso peptide [Paenibacillus sedimenti]